MAKKYYFGYNSILGELYVNNKGESLAHYPDIIFSTHCSSDIKSLKSGLEKALKKIGSDLGKRKVELYFDKFYESVKPKISYLSEVYIKRVSSINFK